MTIVRFDYKKIRGTYQPIITIGINFSHCWVPLEAYVDSGAEYTVIEAGIAESMGFDYRQGKKIYVKVGDGSLIPVYLNSLNVQLGAVRSLCRVGFSDRLNVNMNILGKTDIFDKFEICFLQSQHRLTFTEIPENSEN